MTFRFFLFLTWVLGLVASYPNYQVNYPHEAYYQHSDWSNSQGYPNARAASEPAYPHYVPQHPPQYAHNLPLTKPHNEQEYHYLPETEPVQNEQEFNAPLVGRENWNIQAEAYNAQPAAPLSHSYQETARPNQDERNYNYGGSRQPSPPPGNTAYDPESYAPPIQRQWRHPYSHAPPVNPQDTYQLQYPYWQSRVPAQNSYYNDPQGEQNIYDPPVQYAAHAEAQAQVPSEYNFQKRESRPNSIKNTPSGKQNYLIVYPNGTTEHVDVLDDAMLGNSQHIKSINHKTYEIEAKKIPHDNKKNNEFKNIAMRRDGPKHKDENHTGKNTPVDHTSNNYYDNPQFKSTNHENPTEPVWDHNQNKHTFPVSNQPQENHFYTQPENKYSNPAPVLNDDGNKNPEKNPIPQAIDYGKNKESPTTNDITTASPYNENYTKKSEDTFSGDVIPTSEKNHYEVAPGSTWNPEDNSKIENTTPGYNDDSFSVDEAHRKNDGEKEGDERKKHISTTESSPFIEDEIKTSSSMDTGYPDDTKGKEKSDGDAKLQDKLLSQLNKAGFSLDFDSGTLKHSNQKVPWLPANELLSELLTPENMSEYDTVVVFNMALRPIIQKNSTVYLYRNGTIKEEIIETSWDRIGDIIPRQIKTTTIITNPYINDDRTKNTY